MIVQNPAFEGGNILKMTNFIEKLKISFDLKIFSMRCQFECSVVSPIEKAKSNQIWLDDIRDTSHWLQLDSSFLKAISDQIGIFFLSILHFH